MQQAEIIKGFNFENKEKLVNFLYKEYFAYIRKYIISNGGTPDDAKDIFQDTVISFITKFNEYQESCNNLKALLLTIAKNKWIDQKRKEKRVGYMEEISPRNEIEEGPTASSPLERIHNKERAKAIDRVLSSLGDRCKELLVNTLYYGMTMKDIADSMGFSNEDSAKTQHYKCRQKLIAQYKNDEQLKMMLQ